MIYQDMIYHVLLCACVLHVGAFRLHAPFHASGELLEQQIACHTAGLLATVEGPPSSARALLETQVDRNEVSSGSCYSSLGEAPYRARNDNKRSRPALTGADVNNYSSLTDSEFATLPVRGDHSLLVGVLKKLESGGSATILVLGGSETDRASCNQRFDTNDTVSGSSCSWPERLRLWLGKVFPAGKLAMVKVPQRGTPSGGSLGLLLHSASLESGSIDIVMVDTLADDSYCSNSEQKAMEYEALIRSLHAAAPRAVIYPVFDGCKHCVGKTADQQRSISQYYDLPRMDFAQLSIRNPDVAYEQKRPHWQVHQVMADAITNDWGKALRASCSDPWVPGVSRRESVFKGKSYWPQAQLDGFSACPEPLTVYSASAALNNATSTNVSALRPIMDDNGVGGWRLLEEDQSKTPGWISEKASARMRFSLRVGASPAVAIVFMSSPTGLGIADLSIVRAGAGNRTGGRKMLPPLAGVERRSEASMFEPLVFSVNLRSYIGREWEIGDELELEVTNRDGRKFQLMKVLSC